MLFGGLLDGAALELRASGDGSTRLRGRFPYGSRAVLSDGPRPRHEEFRSGAFADSLNSGTNIFLLAGHTFDKPLASTRAGTLTFSDAADALTFDAEIKPEIAGTSYGADTLRQIASGLVGGISPGFQIPQVAGAEEIRQEPTGALLRSIHRAVLHEFSVVTRPAYDKAQVEARNWSCLAPVVQSLPSALARWRL
jgi:HK97 family phage prohead protease